MTSGHDRFKSLFKILTGTTAAYVLIIALSLPLIYLFGFRDMRFFLVPSGSMEPTLFKKDCLITLTRPEYQRGEVVVLHDPLDPEGYLVKRIVAVGGDTVAVSGGALFVNNAYVSEPYVLSPPEYEMSPVRVPPGEILLLGDNRNNSDDSHMWEQKTVPQKEVVGKAILIYYPYARAGMLRSYYAAMATEPSL
jgi:signal peptidase I